MRVFNPRTSFSGGMEGLASFMLIGEKNAGVGSISLQYSEVQAGYEQPLHRHQPEQCYYIISGTGLMIIEEESCQVDEGDAIYIPPDALHGIKNNGPAVLKYLTANAPAFGADYEMSLWPQNSADRIIRKSAPGCFNGLGRPWRAFKGFSEGFSFNAVDQPFDYYGHRNIDQKRTEITPAIHLVDAHPNQERFGHEGQNSGHY